MAQATHPLPSSFFVFYYHEIVSSSYVNVKHIHSVIVTLGIHYSREMRDPLSHTTTYISRHRRKTSHMSNKNLVSAKTLVFGTLLGILPDAKVPLIFAMMDCNADRIHTEIMSLAKNPSDIHTMHQLVKLSEDYSLSTNVPPEFLEEAYAGLTDAMAADDVPHGYTHIVEAVMASLDSRLKTVIVDTEIDVEEISFDPDPTTLEIEAMTADTPQKPQHPLWDAGVDAARHPLDSESHEILASRPTLPVKDPGLLNRLSTTPADKNKLPTR